MSRSVRHLWFDFSDTLGRVKKEAHDALVYGAYADAVGKELTPGLKKEYDALRAKHKSNSGVFFALGFPHGYVSDLLGSVPVGSVFELVSADVPAVLASLKDILPVSVFSNSKLDALLPALGIDPALFTHRLGPDQVKVPKPALDGFRRMVELSGISAEETMFVGDDPEKDLVPAKKVGMQTGLLWKPSEAADHWFENFAAIERFFKGAP